MSKKGFIIAFEGLDKSGKATQVKNVVKYLQSKNVPTETMDFPQYNTFFGQIIKKYLCGEFGDIDKVPAELIMPQYTLDRIVQMPTIKKWLSDDKWVVLDRYSYSNCFSVAKFPPELWPEKIKFLEDLEFNQTKLPKPDHCIYLRLESSISFNMRNHGLKPYQNGQADIHEKNQDLLRNVDMVYNIIAEKDPANWTVINQMNPDDTRMSPEEIFAKIKPVIDRLLKEHRKQNIFVKLFSRFSR